MAGVTATISVTAFRADWMTHMPMRALCDKYTITRDQVVRLRDVWELPLRNDRKLRWKPKRTEIRDPTPDEIEQAKLEIQAGWDAATREARTIIKTQHVRMRVVETTPDLRQYLETLNDGET